MLVRLRVSLPDRPGVLGRVGSAIGGPGADIERVEVLESESGRAVDDVVVQVASESVLDRAVNSLSAIPGVSVLGMQRPAPPTTGHAELELVRLLVTRPAAALQTLVDGAPSAFGADWAVVAAFSGEHGAEPGTVVTHGVRYPGGATIGVAAPLRLRSVLLERPGTSEPCAGAAVVPLEGTSLGLVLVREVGLDFHRSELWRLGQLGEIAGGVLAGSSAR